MSAALVVLRCERVLRETGVGPSLEQARKVRVLVRIGKIPNSVAGVLILAPAVVAFLYVGVFGVDLVFGDAYTMVPFFDQLSRGTLSLGDLWEQHYEHRLFFPRVALLLLGVVTGFDQIYAMYLTEALFLVTLGVLLIAYRGNVSSRLLFFVPVAFLIFSLKQWFNMFYAMQVAFALSQFFAVAAFYLLFVATRSGLNRTAFGLAAASGMVASYSLLVGLFVWPVGFLQIFVSPVPRKTRAILAGAWSLCGLGVLGFYLLGLQPTASDRQSTLYVFDNFGLDVIRFFLTALGSPIFRQPQLALLSGLLIGGLLVMALLYVYRAGKLGEHSFWLAVLAFSLMCLVALALGRAGNGVDQALQSRYVTFTSLGIVGAYVMLLKLALEGDGRWALKFSLGILAGLIVLSVPASYAFGIPKGARKERQGYREAAALASYSSKPDAALYISHRTPEIVREEAFVLCKLGYSVFSRPGAQARNCLPPRLKTLSPTTPPPGASDNIGIDPVRTTDDTMEFSGYAVSENGDGPVGGAYVEIDGERFPAFYGRLRKDARGGSGVPYYEFSGFEVGIPTSEIGPGEHEVSVTVVTKDRKEYYSPDEKRTFRAKRAP